MPLVCFVVSFTILNFVNSYLLLALNQMVQIKEGLEGIAYPCAKISRKLLNLDIVVNLLVNSQPKL